MPKDQSSKNDKEIAVLKTEVKALSTTVDRIENNHLAHIAADIKSVSADLNNFRNFITQKITDLSITDARREPAFNLGSEVVRSIVMAVIAGLMFLLIDKRI